MTAVYCSRYLMNDDNDPVTVEDVYKHYSAVGGIHSFSFDNDVTNFDGTEWTTASDVTIGETVVQTGSDANDRPIWHNDAMPHSYAFEFTYYAEEWAAYVRGNGSDSYYRIHYDATFTYIDKYESGVVTQSWSREHLFVDDQIERGRIKIAVRDAQYTSDSPGRIITISIWLNDHVLFSVADNVTSNNPPLYMALVVPTGMSDGTIYSDFRISNLGEIIQWSSLDPRERPMDAISRAIEDRYIKSWMRWNGTLRVWSPKARTVSATVSRSREYGLVLSTDVRQAFSRLRVLGAFQWIQIMDSDMVREIGDRFAEINNTALWNADDCYRIGLQMFLRTKEQVYQANLSTFGYLFLEKEDRIALPDTNSASSYVDYILDNISWDYAEGTFRTNLHGRKYYYGEP